MPKNLSLIIQRMIEQSLVDSKKKTEIFAILLSLKKKDILETYLNRITSNLFIIIFCCKVQFFLPTTISFLKEKNFAYRILCT